MSHEQAPSSHDLFARGTPVQHRTAFGLIVLLLLLTFYVPTVVAPRFAWSDSYMFGFNNRWSEILFGLVLMVTAATVKGFGLRFRPVPRQTGESPKLSARLLWACLTVAAVACTLSYWLNHSVGGILDGAYFLDRIHLIVRGQKPFQDFEFVYGSLSLYASIVLGRMLHVGADNGYYLLWISETLLGMTLLWWTIRWIDLPDDGKRTVFLLYFVVFLLCIPVATLNYCALRYTLPLFGLVTFCRLQRAGSGVGWRLLTLASTWLLAALVMGLSPEEGLVFTVATAAYLPLCRMAARQPFLADTAILWSAYWLLYRVSAHAGAFGTMKRFGAGAFNLPVYPGAITLLAFAVMLVIVCYLATGALAERILSNVFLLGIYSVGMLPGAMGRCDSIHVAGYLMAAVLCVLLLTRPYPVAWHTATIAFVLIVIVIPLTSGMILGPPLFTKAFLNHLYAGGSPQGSLGKAVDHIATRFAVRTLGEERGLAKIVSLRSSAAAISVDPHVVFPDASAVVAVPFEYLPNKLSNYQAWNVEEGYYMGLSNITMPEQVDAKIAELVAHPEQNLVVSTEGFTQCLVHSGDRRTLAMLLEIPWVPQPKHDVAMFVPYCTYIQTHYEWVHQPSPRTFGYGLMRFRKL